MITVDAQRLKKDLIDLGSIGRTPSGGLSRTSFSAEDLKAREWFTDRCTEAGLKVETDGIGNLIVSSPRADALTDPSLPAVWSGSHIDTVPDGGAFDGALGSIAALECLRRIHETGAALNRPVRCVVYADEEGNYASLLGSRALTRGFSRAELETLTGRDGDRFADTFTAAGGDLDAAAAAKLPDGIVDSSVELHIEQGPVLEERGIDIGVVTGIVALGSGTVTFHGRADHAGTTPMNARQDAGVAAGAFLASLPEVAARAGERAVVTAGMVTFIPGGANVVPEAARVTLDFREPTADGVAVLEALLIAQAQEIAAAHGLECTVDFAPTVPPAPLDEGVQAIIADAASARGLSHMPIPSGAGHDSQNIATIAPTGMIFVPSVGGRSHCPEENTRWDDVARGAQVLMDTILALANR
ncbi:Zn-dependent hydrolase [Sediminivirga luteola]|uniref:Zn-dependent hydrolase n=1 Tax=Sediminivirga luteola TaxID=1774748 RepID=UPI001F5687DC|nr:Zn-dependent hydrolase [Sediminivirga luteola]MCI2266773.1 Zn-dependent hydrolase [Sediminivirga luteola]